VNSAREEKMEVRVLDGDPSSAWCDYLVTSRLSGRSYRVALRGTERGESYCTCPDYRENTLGTCKHILHVLIKVRRRLGADALTKKRRQKDTNVHLRYGVELALRLGAPIAPANLWKKSSGRSATPISPTSAISSAASIDSNDSDNPLSSTPMPKNSFSSNFTSSEFNRSSPKFAGTPQLTPCEPRSSEPNSCRISWMVSPSLPEPDARILADDMGLGKTIQGVGTAELLAREAGISRVLVVCPTSLKSQWLSEIARFSSRTAILVAGGRKGSPRSVCQPRFLHYLQL
jgi:hypothetical protein